VQCGHLPLDVLLLGEEALEDALLAEGVSLGAAERVDERLEAEAAGVKGLDGVLPQALPLRAVAELPLLLVREEGEVVVVFRVPLRHLRPRVDSAPSPAGFRGSAGGGTASLTWNPRFALTGIRGRMGRDEEGRR